MKRGELYTIAGAGDFSGKPRPGLVVQTDIFNEFHPSLTVCPVSSQLTGDTIFRVPINRDVRNGLRLDSEVEIDKLQAVWARRVGKFVGIASDDVMSAVDLALRRWLQI